MLKKILFLFILTFSIMYGDNLQLLENKYDYPNIFIEKENMYILEIIIPGFNKEDIKFKISNKNNIRILAKNKYKEYQFQKQLPKNINKKNISISLKNGILYIKVMKK